MESYETFYFIMYKINKEDHECGPYESLAEAIDELVNRIPRLASKQSTKIKYNFKAKIEERKLDTESGTWLTISTPIVENPCRKQKLKHTSNLKEVGI